MNEEKRPYLIINEEYDEIKINIKHTKPYMKLQQENKQLKEVIEEVKMHIYSCCYEPNLDDYRDEYEISNMLSEEVKQLLEILDKAKGSDK